MEDSAICCVRFCIQDECVETDVETVPFTSSFPDLIILAALFEACKRYKTDQYPELIPDSSRTLVALSLASFAWALDLPSSLSRQVFLRMAS